MSFVILKLANTSLRVSEMCLVTGICLLKEIFWVKIVKMKNVSFDVGSQKEEVLLAEFYYFIHAIFL